MKKISVLVFVAILVLPFSGMAQEKSLRDSISSNWTWFSILEKETMTPSDIMEQKQQNDAYIFSVAKDDQEAFFENQVSALWEMRNYYLKHQDAVVDKKSLTILLDGLDFNSDAFISYRNIWGIIEAYFAAKALVDGKSPSWVFAKKHGDYVFEKYKTILETKNETLMEKYFSFLSHDFILQGYSDALRKIRPYINKYLPEGEVKAVYDSLYRIQDRLDVGQPVPASMFLDSKGHEVYLTDVKGQYVVVDAWATWCGGCIKKLPYFVALAEKYKNRDDVIFLTISIDNESETMTWKEALKTYNLLGLVNLIASENRSTFQVDYFVRSVPKYFVIDKEGRFVDSMAPHPGEGLEELLEELLK